MLRFALTVASCIAISVCKATAPAPLPERVDQAIRDRITAGMYPSVVVAVVDGDRSEVRVFGKIDTGGAPDAETVYEIGSVTKTFTATLLAQAVLSKDLTLDQPVSSLLPGFALPSRNGKAITLGTLAMQNSGLPRLPANFVPQRANDPYVDYDTAKLKSFLATYALPRDPGASYEYSNLGVALLGYALAVHAGTDYESLLRQHVLTPLGMHDTGIALTHAMQAHLAHGHDDSGRPVPNWNLALFAGAGGIRSTARDMLRYLRANMGVLPTPLYASMQLAQTPRSDGPRPEDRIGLVWMTHQLPGGNIIWHSGLTGGYASFVGFTADRRHGVVVLTNAAVTVDDLGFATLDAGWQLQPAHKRVAMTADELDAYVGSYQLSPTLVVRITRNGDRMVAQATGQPAVPFFASAKNEFFADAIDVGFSFTRDTTDHVTGVTVHQHGDHVAPRLSEAAADAAQGNTLVTLDTATLNDYVGQYQMAPGVRMVISLEANQLMAKLASQSSFPVFASARDRFFYRVVQATLDFERDANGKVTAVVLHQNGKDHRAPKALP